MTKRTYTTDDLYIDYHKDTGHYVSFETLEEMEEYIAWLEEKAVKQHNALNHG